MKRSISILLIAALTAATVFCGGCMDDAAPASSTPEFTLAPIEGPLWELIPPASDIFEYVQQPTEPVVANTDLPPDWDGVRDAALALLYNDVDSVDVSHCNLPVTQETVDYLYYKILEEPWFLRLASDGSLTYEYLDGRITRLLRKSPDKAKEKRMYYDAMDAMTVLLYGLRDDTGLTMAQKLLLLHDRLVAFCRFDEDANITDTLPDEDFSAYGPLVLRSGVCNGYANAMLWMMRSLGCEVEYASSVNMAHAWVNATPDGSTYILDASHDDYLYMLPGSVYHDNFLVSSQKYADNHPGVTPDWDMSFTDTRYENEFWNRTLAQVLYVNGYLFFVDKDTGDLIARSLSGKETPILNVQQAYTDFGYPYGAAAKITSVGYEILYTQPRSVCAYNPLTGDVRTVYTAPDSLFRSSDEVLLGLDRIAGKVRVYPSNSPNDYPTANMARYGEFTCCTHPNAVPYTVSDGSEKLACPDCMWIV